MTYEEEQALNFRKVLGLDGDETKSSEPEAGPVNEEPQQSKQAEETTRVKKGKKAEKEIKGEYEETRRSIKIPVILHQKLKLLTFWTRKNGILDNPSIPDIIEDALAFYLEKKYPEAQKFINKSL